MPERRTANVVAALALALTDELEAATVRATDGHTGAGPAAVVALRHLLAGRSVDDLRRAVGLTHSGGVRLVDRLVADGLVERRPGADGRSVAVALTPRGRAMARRAMDARLGVVEQALAALEPHEEAALIGIAEKLLTHIVDARLARRAAGDVPPGGWLCRLCDPVACGRPEGRCPAANAAS